MSRKSKHRDIIEKAGRGPKEDLTGHVFSMLTVLQMQRLSDSHKYGFYAKCKCVCGNEIYALPRNLKLRITQSCGCRRDQYEKITHEKSLVYTGYEGITGTFWGKVKLGARKRNISFDVTIEEAWAIFNKQNGKCAYSGLDLILPKSTRSYRTCDYTASIDRIDSSKGYTKENIQWVHKDINVMKLDYSEEAFIKYCVLVSKFRNGEKNDTR